MLIFDAADHDASKHCYGKIPGALQRDTPKKFWKATTLSNPISKFVFTLGKSVRCSSTLNQVWWVVVVLKFLAGTETCFAWRGDLWHTFNCVKIVRERFSLILFPSTLFSAIRSFGMVPTVCSSANSIFNVGYWYLVCFSFVIKKQTCLQ